MLKSPFFLTVLTADITLRREEPRKSSLFQGLPGTCEFKTSLVLRELSLQDRTFQFRRNCYTTDKASCSEGNRAHRSCEQRYTTNHKGIAGY